MKTEHVIGPHGAFRIRLVEDSETPADRIYEVSELRTDGTYRKTNIILGSEIEDLGLWWMRERNRDGEAGKHPCAECRGSGLYEDVHSQGPCPVCAGTGDASRPSS